MKKNIGLLLLIAFSLIGCKALQTGKGQNMSLTDKYWRLTELNAAPVTKDPTTTKEANLILKKMD